MMSGRGPGGLDGRRQLLHSICQVRDRLFQLPDFQAHSLKPPGDLKQSRIATRLIAGQAVDTIGLAQAIAQISNYR
jgi:hypothetical protein